MRLNLKNTLFISGGVLFIIAIGLIILSFTLDDTLSDSLSQQFSQEIQNDEIENMSCPIEDCFEKLQFEIPEEIFPRIIGREVTFEILGFQTQPIILEISSPVLESRLVIFRLDEPSEEYLFLPILSSDLFLADELIIRDTNFNFEYILNIETVENQANFPNLPVCPDVCETTTLILS